MRCSRVLLAFAYVLLSTSAYAAGTVTRGQTFDDRFTFTWVSDGSGGVSGDVTTIRLMVGEIVRVEIIPNGGATQPSDLYDLTLLDTHGVDILGGAGANLSNSAATMVVHPDIRIGSDETFQLVIANAGNAKGGTVKIWVGR